MADKHAVHYSSDSETWQTPMDFFNKLDAVWNFTLDPACVPSSAKCQKYFTPQMDGLSQDWSGDTFFLNPPYGRVIKDWMKKSKESYVAGGTGVCLVPSRTDTTYVHSYVFDGATAVCFIKGRLKFDNSHMDENRDKNKLTPAPFPSMIVVYDNNLTDEKIEVLEGFGKVVKL